MSATGARANAASAALEVLFDVETAEPSTAAERRYGGALRFPDAGAPYVITNFVSTIDGVVSLALHDGSDSATVGGHAAADRFVMAMLRAAADAVLIGARTLADSAGHQWTPAALVPALRDELDDYRRALRRPAKSAPLAIVSATGRLPAHVALDAPATPVVVMTTDSGARALEGRADVETMVVAPAGRIDGATLLGALAARGWGTVLCEGGPALTGTLVASGGPDELFLTIAPQLAGRDAAQHRPGMVQGFAADPRALPGCSLHSVRRAAGHLFLRYRREP